MANFSSIIATIDAHAGGEPARIVTTGLPTIAGATMVEKKSYFQQHLDHYRTLLLREPRGHKDMFGVLLTPATSSSADYGVLFMDNGGYIDMCGHGIMSATAVLLETGMIYQGWQRSRLVFDTPAGQIESSPQFEVGRVRRVTVSNVASFLYASDVELVLPEIGAIHVDIAFGGNFFALVPAKALGVEIRPDNTVELARLGLLIKQMANERIKVQHPLHEHIKTVELTEIYETSPQTNHFSRSTVVFGDGQIDRCPCGTGTCAAMAALYAKGRLSLGQEYTNEGILGSRFEGMLKREVKVGRYVAVAPVVTGSAYITGMHHFVLDPQDPLTDGFVLG
jgi:proline racemase